MRVRLMQRIDYWVGVPLCAAVSLLDLLIRPFRRKVAQVPIQRILFIELSEMGSAFLAYSVLTRAVERVGRENVFFLIFEKNRESVDLLNLIPRENVITIPDDSFLHFALGSIKALVRMNTLRLDTCLDLELFSRATALLSYFSGATRRVGFDKFTEEGLYRGSFITHRVFLNNHQHIALNFLALLRALDSPVQELPLVKEDVRPLLLATPKVTPDQQELEKIQKRLQRLYPQYNDSHEVIVVNPDPGLLTLRGWPVSRFRELCTRILEERPRALLLCMGLPRSSTFAKQIFPEEFKERCIDFCGQTDSLRDVISLFSFSRLLITNDSGPGHLAALAQIPAVVMFGPESPVKYGPLGERVISLFANLSCSPCYSPANHRHSICTNNRCLQAISVDEVFDAATLLLNNQSLARHTVSTAPLR